VISAVFGDDFIAERGPRERELGAGIGGTCRFDALRGIEMSIGT